MRNTTDYRELTWNWEEEVYNEKTEEYEKFQRTTEVEVEVTTEYESGMRYDCGGEPGYREVEIVSEFGDELDDWERERIIKLVEEDY